MAATLKSPVDRTSTRSVKPSILSDGERTTPFTLEQELTPFARWTSAPIWVPPKDESKDLATSMVNRFGAFASKERCWSALTAEHRAKFTQVREIELYQASIRLPQGRLYVSITEQENFDKITDDIPACVQTRLDEFMAGPGRKPGVKVYYLKPLCIETEDKLIFTSGEQVQAAITKIQDEVFSEYRRMYLFRRPAIHALNAVDLVMDKPRKVIRHILERKKRKIDRYQAQLEFNRRKAVMKATKARKKYRTDECTYESILALTKPVERRCALAQYAQERELSKAQVKSFMKSSAKALPWFVAMPLAAGYIGNGVIFVKSLMMIMSMPPLILCDPVFVAEMPGEKGVLLKIGHFDVVDGVTHVEI